MLVYIWSDLHIKHTNIIKYESRPFDNVDEMDKHFIKMWKNTIKKQDTIITLGDVFFKIDKEEAKKYYREFTRL